LDVELSRGVKLASSESLESTNGEVQVVGVAALACVDDLGSDGLAVAVVLVRS
jgi:hypothetical protein